MDNPTARIVSLVDSDDGARAIVAVDVAAACPRCAAGKGCGAGLFGADSSTREVEARLRAGLHVSIDDIVEISLAPTELLHAAIIVYGLPMLGAAIGAIIAFYYALGDSAAAIAALIGLAAGLAAGRWRLQQEQCVSQFVPTVERRI